MDKKTAYTKQLNWLTHLTFLHAMPSFNKDYSKFRTCLTEGWGFELTLVRPDVHLLFVIIPLVRPLHGHLEIVLAQKNHRTKLNGNITYMVISLYSIIWDFFGILRQ